MFAHTSAYCFRRVLVVFSSYFIALYPCAIKFSSLFRALQQALAELSDSGLIKAQTIRNRTRLTNTKEGNETLQFFGNRISDAIREDIAKFFDEQEINLRSQVNITADYYKSTSGEYEVHMVAKEKEVTLVDLTLSVPDETMAEEMCDKWEKQNQEIYQYLMTTLL